METAWWSHFLDSDVHKDAFTETEINLFEKYELSLDQKRIFHIISKKTRNIPAILKNKGEELIWCICVCDFDHRNEMKYYLRIVEERFRKLEQAEASYKFLSGTWNETKMEMLIQSWSEGMLVIDPTLQTRDNQVLQFVHEFHHGVYPSKKEQTDEWYKRYQCMYVLMTRAILKSYPNAAKNGIVSFSEMKDFDWEVYDENTKSKNAHLYNIIPHPKMCRMIAVHPDEKMKQFFKDMTPQILKKWGFVQYETYEEAIEKELTLPDNIPSFVGGEYSVDVLECLKALFKNDEEALQLMLKVYKQLKDSGNLSVPKHMQ